MKHEISFTFFLLIKTLKLVHPSFRGIDQLITMVENKTASGYLIDRNTFHYFNNRLKDQKYHYIARRVRQMPWTRTEKSNADSHLACGMLVRNLEDYEYFSGYLDNSRLAMHSCNDIRMNTRKEESGDGGNFLTSDSQLFKKVITYILVIVGCVVLVGIVIEGVRYCTGRKKRHSSEDNSVI